MNTKLTGDDNGNVFVKETPTTKSETLPTGQAQIDEWIAIESGDALFESRNAVTQEAFRLMILSAIQKARRLSHCEVSTTADISTKTNE